MTPNALLQGLPKQACLAFTDGADRLCVLRIMFRSFRHNDVSRSQEVPNAVVAWSTVDVSEVVGRDVERSERPTITFCPLSKERIEHRFPRGSVDTRGVGQHAIKVEDRRVEVAPIDRD